jgi:hypothetical protein
MSAKLALNDLRIEYRIVIAKAFLAKTFLRNDLTCAGAPQQRPGQS